MGLTLFKKRKLFEKTYGLNEYPPQKKGEYYQLFNGDKRVVIYNDAPVFEMASAGGPKGWGNHVAWDTYPNDKGGDGKTGIVIGFCRTLPKVGELIVSQGSSNLYHYFAITKVMPCKNPADMFYADVKVILSSQEKLDNVTVMN